MEIKTLKTFLAVIEEGTISHAALRLNCVQSNVTSRIKMLEDELDVQLFVRSRRGMALTAAGELLVSHAEKVVESESRARAAVADFSTTVKSLRIGSMESTLAIRLPKFIAEFRAAHAAIKLGVVAAPTDDLVHQLLDHKIDIAFIGGEFLHPSLEGRVAFSEEMVLVTDTSIAQPEQTGAAPVIVFKPGCSYRAYSETWMKRSGLSPNETIELGTLDGILGCVASGIGVTLLPRSVVECSHHRPLVNIHALSDPDRFIDTVALVNLDAPPNGAIAAFVDLVCGDQFSRLPHRQGS